MQTIRVLARCKDMCNLTFKDDETGETKESEGYVPGPFAGEFGSNYVDLTIDINTGKIVNWEVLTEQDIKDIFGPYDED